MLIRYNELATCLTLDVYCIESQPYTLQCVAIKRHNMRRFVVCNPPKRYNKTNDLSSDLSLIKYVSKIHI